MSIEDFKANISNLARPTLFEVEFVRLGQTMKFLCKSASLPGSTMGIIEVPYLGRKIKIAGDRTFEDWELSISADVSFAIRDELLAWHNQINDAELNVGTVAIADYMEDAKVRQLGADKSVIKEYTLFGMFPSNIGQMDLAFDSNDTTGEFTVTMAYQYFK